MPSAAYLPTIKHTGPLGWRRVAHSFNKTTILEVTSRRHPSGFFVPAAQKARVLCRICCRAKDFPVREALRLCLKTSADKSEAEKLGDDPSNQRKLGFAEGLSQIQKLGVAPSGRFLDRDTGRPSAGDERAVLPQIRAGASYPQFRKTSQN